MQHMERENLDVVFRRTAPESILNKIRTYDKLQNDYFLYADPQNLSFNAYDHFGLLNFQEYSIDEMRLRHTSLQENIKKNSDDMVFGLLYSYADNILKAEQKEPICKLDQILNWNSISSRLGQDIFTTAWFAKNYHSIWKEREDYLTFDWSSIIRTDDKKLNMMIETGLAENHFHLNGSTQTFSLSWACLMNHPDFIRNSFSFEKNFKKELTINVSNGSNIQTMHLPQKLLYAAMIRALLFSRCAHAIKSNDVCNEFKKFDAFPSVHQVVPKIKSLRITYGEKFKQKNGQKKCLDYAISKHFYNVDSTSYNRLLGGERNFLYLCFVHQFNHDFSLMESSLFYLYLLIKSNFRSELIQINKRVGFKNFAEYQNRKNQFFGTFTEYWTEAQRLAICATSSENHLTSLEARIMPKTSPAHLIQEINSYDKLIDFSYENKENAIYPFYVTHFPKKRFTASEFKKQLYPVPRNYPIRKKIQKMAYSLAILHSKCTKYSSRIIGIDACSNEIGCRPETFATEFRYLRAVDGPKHIPWYMLVDKQCPQPLRITYHAGEDFLDICDGLRAIDETITFLEFQKGDRLGHALALGIDSEDYYDYKRRTIVMTKQDFLDNCIWLLFRSLEWNIDMATNLREKLKETARSLIYEIFQLEERNLTNFNDNIGEYGNILELYYYSWLLRGDHPDLYSSGKFSPNEKYQLHMNGYQQHMYPQKNEQLNKYRNSNFISYLYYLYHYDKTVKLNGLKTYSFSASNEYIELISRFQNSLQKHIAKEGIAIECNPTSNVLIGTFKYYDRHPILTFNNHFLEDDGSNPQIKVSINTDDLGVFDTSLRNEYALLLSSICRKRHSEGNYNDEAVYEYLDYIRKNGIEMTF